MSTLTMRAFYSPADGKRGVSAMTEDVARKLIEQDDEIARLRAENEELRARLEKFTPQP